MTNLAFRTAEVQFDDVQITVHAQTLRNELEKRDLEARLKEKIPFGADYLFAYLDAVTQTDKADGIGFKLPSANASDEAHLAAYEKFISLPTWLINTWYGACSDASSPSGTNPDLHPGADVKDNPKGESVA